MRALRAKTTFPNTPESDLQECVLHDVYMSNGLVTRMMATDPMDAIAKVNKAIDNHETMVLA